MQSAMFLNLFLFDTDIDDEVKFTSTDSLIFNEELSILNVLESICWYSHHL